VLCFCHPDDDAQMWAKQEDTILRLFHACRRNRLEMLLEVIPSKVGVVTEHTTPALINRFYDLGIYPDWWKLEPFTTDAAWAKACAAITARDPYCRGIVVLGLGSTEAALADSFALAARHELVRGFAVGRTIFAEPAWAWLAGQATDSATVTAMATTFERLCGVWDTARSTAKGAP
jgi:5-dehydro-2-deoxygluconokinase